MIIYIKLFMYMKFIKNKLKSYAFSNDKYGKLNYLNCTLFCIKTQLKKRKNYNIFYYCKDKCFKFKTTDELELFLKLAIIYIQRLKAKLN